MKATITRIDPDGIVEVTAAGEIELVPMDLAAVRQWPKVLCAVSALLGEDTELDPESWAAALKVVGMTPKDSTIHAVPARDEGMIYG